MLLPPSPPKEQRLAYSLTLLRMFELKDYRKFVYLDADMVIVRNVDDLFEQPSFSAAPTFQLNKKRKNKNGPQGNFPLTYSS